MSELNINLYVIYDFSVLSLGMILKIGPLFYSSIYVLEFFSQRYNTAFGLLVALCLLIAWSWY
ncbi:hypothetical protein FSC845_00515 [Francisella persica ATCC VR-331]|nr:hypothetical protein [Francisella persica]ANH77151.1 hypothetical protein FSC845_00515 [Francisella persica ATCC VR-331]